MTYRSTKEKAEAQKVARKLYVTDRLSLKEIHEQTGETMRTLRSWCTLGDWDSLREAEDKTELDRLESLRDSLLDKAEAQIKAGKLPHIETGLIYKLERLIVQREKKEERATTIMGNTLRHLALYLMEHDPKLARALVINHMEEFSRWIVKQDLVRPPEEADRSVQELIHLPREFSRVPQEPTPAQKRFARMRKGAKGLPRMRKGAKGHARMRKNLPPSMK